MAARNHLLTRALAALCAVAAWSLTACSGGDDGADPGPGETTTPGIDAGTQTPTSPSPTAAPDPVVGACYRLTVAQLAEAHVDAVPVPCAQEHTTQTYLVTSLPALAEPADGETVARAADQRCRTSLRGHVRATPARLALSRVRHAWFVPTDDEVAEGARWLRCDLAVSRTDTTLASLPARTAGLLRREAALDRYGACARTNQAGISQGRGGRMCALPHSWRAVSAKRLGSPADAFPGRSVRGDVLARCEDDARAFTGNSTGDIAVGWLPPTAATWAEGQRFGLCWTRTRR